MIYDIFIFDDELDVLEIRLNVLHEHVDQFIVIESPRSIGGQAKPLHYRENSMGRFAGFAGQIISLCVNDLPHAGTCNEMQRWANEFRMRNALSEFLPKIALTNQDWIVWSDADEIWDPEAWPANPTSPFVFQCVTRSFFLNAAPEKYFREKLSLAARALDFQRRTPQEWRALKHHYPAVWGGWHLRWMGKNTPARLREKLSRYAHCEEDRYREYLARLQTTLCERPDLIEEWPDYLQEHWLNYSHLIKL